MLVILSSPLQYHQRDDSNLGFTQLDSKLQEQLKLLDKFSFIISVSPEPKSLLIRILRRIESIEKYSYTCNMINIYAYFLNVNNYSNKRHISLSYSKYSSCLKK